MRNIFYTTVAGERRFYQCKTGPAPMGYVKLPVMGIPPEYKALMLAKKDECAISMAEQVRQALRLYFTDGLCNPVYTGLQKQ